MIYETFFEVNNLTPNIYSHHNQESFRKNLSIIDVIDNLGWLETSKYVKG